MLNFYVSNKIKLMIAIAVTTIVAVFSFTVLRPWMVYNIKTNPDAMTVYAIFAIFVIAYGTAYNAGMKHLNVVHLLPNNFILNIIPISLEVQINKYYYPFTGKKCLGILNIILGIVSVTVTLVTFIYIHLKVGYLYLQGIHIIAASIIIVVCTLNLFCRNLALTKIISYYNSIYSFTMARVYLLSCGIPLLAIIYFTFGLGLYLMTGIQMMTQYLAFVVIVASLASPFIMSHYMKKCMEQKKYKELLASGEDPVTDYLDAIERSNY